MSKAHLEFNLPEEKEEFDIALNGLTYLCALDDLDHYLRNKLKHDTLTSEQELIYEEIRNKLWEYRGNL